MWFVTKIYHFFVFVYRRGEKKTSLLVENIFGPMKMFSWPMKMFSGPPPINKNKEVTNFCDKSRHLFLWQTNRTRLKIFRNWLLHHLLDSSHLVMATILQCLFRFFLFLFYFKKNYVWVEILMITRPGLQQNSKVCVIFYPRTV